MQHPLLSYRGRQWIAQLLKDQCDTLLDDLQLICTPFIAAENVADSIGKLKNDASSDCTRDTICLAEESYLTNEVVENLLGAGHRIDRGVIPLSLVILFGFAQDLKQQYKRVKAPL